MNVHVESKIGKKTTNEDKFKIFLNKNGDNDEYNNIDFYGIYDGHGGKHISEYLSKKFYKFFINKKLQIPLNLEQANKLYIKFNNNMKKKLLKKAHDSGSTALIITNYKNKNGEDYLQILNTGDSRAVISKKNMALPLTKDHKPDNVNEVKRIEKLYKKYKQKDKNEINPLRFDDEGKIWRMGSLAVSRAFGDFDEEKYVTCKPDIYNYKISKDDQFIIMATDGLWDVLSPQDAVEFVLHHLNENNEIIRPRNKKVYEHKCNIMSNRKNIASDLVNYAISKGSYDNVTAIVFFL